MRVVLSLVSFLLLCLLQGALGSWLPREIDHLLIGDRVEISRKELQDLFGAEDVNRTFFVYLAQAGALQSSLVPINEKVYEVRKGLESLVYDIDVLPDAGIYDLYIQAPGFLVANSLENVAKYRTYAVSHTKFNLSYYVERGVPFPLAVIPLRRQLLKELISEWVMVKLHNVRTAGEKFSNCDDVNLPFSVFHIDDRRFKGENFGLTIESNVQVGDSFTVVVYGFTKDSGVTKEQLEANVCMTQANTIILGKSDPGMTIFESQRSFSDEMDPPRYPKTVTDDISVSQLILYPNSNVVYSPGSLLSIELLKEIDPASFSQNGVPMVKVTLIPVVSGPSASKRIIEGELDTDRKVVRVTIPPNIGIGSFYIHLDTGKKDQSVRSIFPVLAVAYGVCHRPRTWEVWTHEMPASIVFATKEPLASYSEFKVSLYVDKALSKNKLSSMKQPTGPLKFASFKSPTAGLAEKTIRGTNTVKLIVRPTKINPALFGRRHFFIGITATRIVDQKEEPVNIAVSDLFTIVGKNDTPELQPFPVEVCVHNSLRLKTRVIGPNGVNSSIDYQSGPIYVTDDARPSKERPKPELELISGM